MNRSALRVRYRAFGFALGLVVCCSSSGFGFGFDIGVAHAAETTTLPEGVWALDESYVNSTVDERWNGNRQGVSLIDPIPRYEPGGGLQGTITAKPHVLYQVLVSQIDYGITDHWTAIVGVPVVLRTTIHTNLGWTPGVYQPELGRTYSQSDFWQWAQSMGQPQPPATWTGNQGALTDMVLGTRYRLPETSLGKSLGIEAAGTVMVALPTGRNPDPEELVTAGTNAWELHSYGDIEGHIAIDKPFFRSEVGSVPRLNLGVDMGYAYFRPRTYAAPKGTLYPLLLDQQPYVGDSYQIRPGNWEMVAVQLEAALWLGPTFASRISSGSLEKAQSLPPMLSALVSYTYFHVEATTFKSDDALWDWQHEQPWGQGDKSALQGTLTLSLLRVGLPVQLYSTYRNQSWIPGKYMQAADSWSAGARLIAKFW
jgi:hypothetical protein